MFSQSLGSLDGHEDDDDDEQQQQQEGSSANRNETSEPAHDEDSSSPESDRRSVNRLTARDRPSLQERDYDIVPDHRAQHVCIEVHW